MVQATTSTEIIIIAVCCGVASIILALIVWKADLFAKKVATKRPAASGDGDAEEELREPIAGAGAMAVNVREPAGPGAPPPPSRHGGASPPLSARRMPFAFGRRDGKTGDYILTETEYKELRRQLAGVRAMPFQDTTQAPAAPAAQPAPSRGSAVDSTEKLGAISPERALPFTPRQADAKGLYTISAADVTRYQEQLHGARPLAFGAGHMVINAAASSAQGFEQRASEPRLGEKVDLLGDGRLTKTVLQPGVGTVRPADGSAVIVSYVGLLPDGTVFDQATPEEPLAFVLGQGMVIDGWEAGIQSMTKGESAVLTIAPDLAYGAEGEGAIPPNTPLTFELTLLDLVQEEGEGAQDEETKAEHTAWANMANVFAAIPKLRLK